MEEWNTFVPIIQKKFLLLQWRRNVTKMFWKWFRKGSSRSSKGMNEKRELVTLAKMKYVWKGYGKDNYRRDWKLLHTMSADLKTARDCDERACGSSWW